MNTFKLILTASFVLFTNVCAADTLAPSAKYTELKNSSYLYALEKKRAMAMQERENREQVRLYIALKQQTAK